jgi:hypothetical protein
LGNNYTKCLLPIHKLLDLLSKTRMARPNNLSLVCLYLSLYISFLLFGHFFNFLIFFLTHGVQIIKRKYIMTNIDTQETIRSTIWPQTKLLDELLKAL